MTLMLVGASPAASTPMNVGSVHFQIATAEAGRTFDRLVLAKFQDKPEIAGQDQGGRLYRLTPSFTQMIVEPMQGQVLTQDNQGGLHFGGVVQGVPLQVMGESVGAQSLSVRDDAGPSLPYTLPETEVFAAGTAQWIDLSPADGAKEIAVITLQQDNTSALSLFFKLQDKLARVMTLPQPRHSGLMDFVGVDDTQSPPALVTLQDPGGNSYLTFHQIIGGKPKVLGKFYGFSSVIPGTPLRPLTVLANADGVAGNEVISFRNDLKNLAFFNYSAQGLRLLRQQTFSVPVASGLTVLTDDQNRLMALGFMDQERNAILLMREKGS
ncbi:MAG: hypothetical protein ACKO43_03795 [Alphaproteobacteria bacterium]